MISSSNPVNPTNTEPTTKPWYKSKTIMMGLLVSLIPFLQYIQALPLGDNTANIINFLLGGLIILNRFYSNSVVS